MSDSHLNPVTAVANVREGQRVVSVQKIDTKNLREQLLKDKQVLEWTGPKAAPAKEHAGIDAAKLPGNLPQYIAGTEPAKRGVDPLVFRLELLKGTPRAYKAVERVAQMAEWGRKREGRALGLAYIDYSGSQVAGIAEVSLSRLRARLRP
mgnify:CR=1 FL=1